jgi:hypothetical protein
MAERDASANKVLAAVTALRARSGARRAGGRVTRADSCPCEVTVQHAARVREWPSRPARGPLPETVRPLGSMAELRAELDQRLDAVRGRPARSSTHGSPSTARPTRACCRPSAACAIVPCWRAGSLRGLRRPQELTCGGCGGHGRVTCGRCGGGAGDVLGVRWHARLALSSCGGLGHPRGARVRDELQRPAVHDEPAAPA